MTTDATTPIDLTERERAFLVDVLRSCEYKGPPDILVQVLTLVDTLTRKLQAAPQPTEPPQT